LLDLLIIIAFSRIHADQKVKMVAHNTEAEHLGKIDPTEPLHQTHQKLFFHITEDKTVTLNLVIDYGSGKKNYPVEITIKEDVTAPTVSGLVDRDGNTIGTEDEIMWNSTLKIEFSEPISSASFISSRDAGTLNLKWGGKEQEAEFLLSTDRKSIMVDLEPLKLFGTITLNFDGLKDDAGLDIDQVPLEVKVKGDDSEDDGPGLAWLIIIIVLVILLIAGVVIYALFLQKKDEKTENELPPEPKQI